MEARRKPAEVEGLSRFLVEHEACEGGFDINHPAGVGSGRVTVTCGGCGTRYEYLRDQVSADGAVAAPPETPQRRAAPAAPERRRGEGRVADRRAPERPPRGAGGSRRPRPQRPRGLEPLAVALIALLLGAVLFAVIRIADGGGDDEPAPAPPPTATADQPSGGEAQESADGYLGVRTASFAVAAPPGWSHRVAGRALLLRPPAGGVSVRVYSQRAPELGLAGMAAGTAGLLRRRSGGGEVSGPTRVRYRGYRAFRMEARTRERRLRATGILAGDHRYLILTSIRRGAPAPVLGQARRAELSFKPR
jgi:hypothetical protein